MTAAATTTAAMRPPVATEARRSDATPLWPATLALTQREVVRFLRQRNRVIGAIATPLVFWLLLGLGLDRATPIPVPDALGGEQPIGYLAYFFPGIVVLMVLFTAIFTTISVIEDRREGFLQSVLVSPAPRVAVVLGKVLGGAVLAAAQGVVMLAIGWLLIGGPGLGGLLMSVAVVAVLSVLLTALGFCFAWPMDSTAGFHAVMNLLLMPMWFLSGAVFPIATAGWLKPVMAVNPLTYGYDLLARAWDPRLAAIGTGLPAWAAAAVLLAATAALLLLARHQVGKPARA